MRDPHGPPDDLDARLEDALGPVAPPARMRSRVLGAASSPSPRRLLALAAPVVAYALGVLTVLALPREVPPPAPAPTTTGVSFGSIADSPPLAPPEAPAPLPEPPPDEPLPRIS